MTDSIWQRLESIKKSSSQRCRFKKQCYMVHPSNSNIQMQPLCAQNLEQHQLSPFYKGPSVSASSLLKLIDELGELVARYRLLAQSLGSSLDGLPLRLQLAASSKKSFTIISCVKSHLLDAFQKVEDLSKVEIKKLESACRVLVACIHMLDRNLRLTRRLQFLFPIPSSFNSDCDRVLFIRTGLSELPLFKHDPLPEADFSSQLDAEILELRNMDLDLHRDATLGPIMDYLTLCPAEALSCSVISIDASPDYQGSDEPVSSTKSSLLCYTLAIFTILLVGSGVLMGVIFIIVVR